MEVVARSRGRAAVRALQVAAVAAAVGGAAVGGGLAGGGQAPMRASGQTSARATLPPTLPPTPLPPPTPPPTPDPSPPPAVGPEEIREAEARLAELGYWTGPVDGVFDPASRHALVAFQKVEGRRRTGRLTPEELAALRKASRPAPRVSGYRHVEVDLRRQVLFVVETGGTVSHILPVSTGSGRRFTAQGWTRRAVTPRGRFTVYRKIPGWRRSPLGLLYFPSYIVGGIAIHGNPSVPPFPASHGCIRIPMYASRAFYDLVPVGTVVIVHDGGPMVQEEDVASPPGAAGPEAAVPASRPGAAGPEAAVPASPPPSTAPPPSPSPTPAPSLLPTPTPTP